MQRTTYLNVILTVNAGLLSVLVWTQLSSRPLLAQTAEAQISSGATAGIPNAAGQREQMIRHLDRINRNMESMAKLMESGKAKVEVTNLSEIKVEAPESDE